MHQAESFRMDSSNTCFDCCRALNTMVYYGQTLNTPNLYGDMYVNFFIGQMVEIPSVIATMWFIYKYVDFTSFHSLSNTRYWLAFE